MRTRLAVVSGGKVFTVETGEYPLGALGLTNYTGGGYQVKTGQQGKPLAQFGLVNNVPRGSEGA